MQTVLMQTITRVARIYLGQTQAEFAKAVNLTQPDLCELEQKTEPYGTIFKYQRISEYLGIGVDVLLRNDFTAIPESFFEKFPPQPYKDAGNSENHSLGRKGEELIFQRERDRVAEGYPTLAKLVLPLYKMDVASPGFDILTFDELGVPYAIEVKTSALSTGAFNLTGNEYAAASAYTKAGERYILTTISNFGTKKQSIQDTVYSELRQTYRIQPAAYRCYPLPEPAPITGIAYGMEPELMGRITQRVELEPLSRDDLRRILLSSENSVLRQYQRFFAEQGMELQVSSKRIEELLDEAAATGSGARGLQTAIENMVQPMLFRIAEKTVESAEWIA